MQNARHSLWYKMYYSDGNCHRSERVKSYNYQRLSTSHHGAALCARKLLALKLILGDGESHLQEILLLLCVNLLHAGGNRSARVTASVHDVLAVMVLRLVQQSLNARLGEAPGTSIQGLLLGPDDSLGVGVHV